MTIRITGLNSGLDTDSIIKELVSAYRSKGDKVKKQQTKLSWTQDKWKSLNAKVLNLYKSLDSLRFTSGYNVKKTTVSDTTKATVTAGKGAVNGTQTLRVNSVAKGGYLTGGQLKNNKKGKSATLADLGYTSGSGTYRISGNGVTKDITVDENTKISDFISQLNNSGTGVQASYDETNQRLFISSKNTGEAADFTLTALDNKGQEALKALGVSVSSKTSSDEAAAWIQYYNSATGAVDTNKLKQDVILLAQTKQDKENYTQDISLRQSHNTQLSSAITYVTAVENVDAVNAVVSDEKDAKALSQLARMTAANRDKNYVREADGTLRAATSNDNPADIINGKQLYDDLKTTYNITEKQNKVDENGDPVLDKNGNPVQEDTQLFKQIKAYAANQAAADAYEKDATNQVYVDEVKDVRTGASSIQSLADLRSKYQDDVKVNNEEIQNNRDSIEAADQILQEHKNIDSSDLTTAMANAGNPDIDAYVASLADKVQYFQDNYQLNSNGDYELKDASVGASKVNGQDAQIELNGALFTSGSNTFNVNGLTIQTLAASTDEITITTATDTQGLYDKVKDFISEYNSIINEMSSLYNADSAKGYEPLTSEEKEALSESDVAEWEKKIKDSLLRRDSNLSTLMNVMTSAMSKSYVVNGKKYSLASLGISTGSYFKTTAANRYELHIDGDADDDTTSANADKLMSMLNSDPDTVLSIIQSAANELYDGLTDQMKTSSLRSFQSIYNDKAMAQSYSDYTKKISSWEQKVTAMEDAYYKKFAAMETALAKLQSQQSAFAGMLGS